MAIRLSTAIDRRRRIRRAAKHIETTLHDFPSARLSVRELAQVACMSPFHFIRQYAHAVRESPDASVRRMRLQIARDMLSADAQVSVTEVAFRIGYENVAAFGRAYRRLFGAAPSSDPQRDVPPSGVTSAVLECPTIRMQALHVERGSGSRSDNGIWSAFDELVGHLDVGAVPRPAQDVYAVVAPEGGVVRAAVRETTIVRHSVHLPACDASGGLQLCLSGQPQSVWAALRSDERLHRIRRYDEPLLLRYLNDPGYRALRDQRVSLFVPLVRGARWPAK